RAAGRHTRFLRRAILRRSSPTPPGGTDPDLLARLTAVCEASAHRVSTSDQFDSQYSFSRSSAAAAAASGCWRSIRVIRRDPNGPCLATDCAHVTTEPPSDPSTEYVECTNPAPGTSS